MFQERAYHTVMRKEIAILFGSTAVIIGNLWLHCGPLGALAFGLWVATAAIILNRRFDPLPLGISVFSLLVLASLPLYFILPMTSWTAGVVFIVLTGILIAISTRNRNHGSSIKMRELTGRITSTIRSTDKYTWAIIILQLLQILFIVASRTSEPLISPWMILPGSTFVLFFTSCFLITRAQIKGESNMLAFAIVQTFIAIGTSACIYGIGFGYDPFVHRTAETALVATGHIEPASMLYSGQYALIGFLHFVTQLSVRTLDIWILPVLASVFLPIASYAGLRDGWKLDEKTARLGWIAALFIPFMLFTFTVPFTFTYVLFAAALFLFPLCRDIRYRYSLIALGLISIFFHPLLGVPITILFVGSSFKTKLRIPFIAIATAVAVPLLLLVYQSGSGVSVDATNLITHFSNFASLFASPFGEYSPRILFWLNALYEFRYWQPVGFFIFGVIASVVLFKKHKNEIATLGAFVLGLGACIYATSTLFTFKGIISHEQQEFALRLLQALYITPMPILAIVIAKTTYKTVAAAILAFCATTSWYFSYPQFNARFAYYSPSVSNDDIDTVHYIDEAAGGKPYLVLSNQMTSAAALQEFGFAHYYELDGEQILWYPVPTGGKLYEYYLAAISKADIASFDDLRARTGIDQIFLVMHSYWVWNPDLVEKIEVQSTQIKRLDDRVTIYQLYGDKNKSEDKDKNADQDTRN